MRLPEFITQISPVGEILLALEEAEQQLSSRTAEKNAQLSVATAEDGLHLWERDYALPSAGSISSRRGRIRAALSGEQTLTRETLEAMAITIGGANRGEVEENFSAHQVTLYALFEGREPESLEALKEAVARRKPAHLTVNIVPVMALRGTVLHNSALTGAVYMELHDTNFYETGGTP